MSVVLEAIKFNHDPTSATSDALNIRRNATQFVTVPEWQRSISINPEDSLAAYSIRETRGNTITIQAKFSRTNPKIQAAEVRAVDAIVHPPGPGGCMGIIIRLIRQILRALFGNVLGEVKARQVTFLPAGYTNFETFKLQYVRLWGVGVGIRTTTWRWQFRLQSTDPWIDFATSNHKVYTLLEVPKSPWQQTPYQNTNTQLPWTEVLDYACRWAFLAATLDDAATGVTRNVYDLGSTVVEYDCPGGGAHHYAFPLWNPTSFNCTAFLERLRGGLGNGRYVNCTDCATLVSTFANILGCDLWQSRMGSGIGLTPLLAIGSTVWQTSSTILSGD